MRAVRDVADGVRLLELLPEGGARPYPLGSHLDLAVLIGDRPDVRSYSLVGEAPVDGAYRIAVKDVAASRGGSRYVRALAPGARVLASRPASHFELQFGRPEYLLVAGGIGVTPLLGMAQALARHGAAVRMVCAARTRGQFAFAAELHAALGARLEVLVSAEGRRLDVAAELRRLHPDGEAYLCGPARLRAGFQAAWRASGRPVERLRFETFGSGGQLAAEPFVVRVRDRGDREVVVPADRSLLDALSDAGVPVMADCRRGECGLCQVKVLEAESPLDHRDVFLGDEERRAGTTLLACVSRAAGGRVTVDTGYRG